MSRDGRWVLRTVLKRLNGQAMVETALVFAILLPIVIGAVDLGRAYFGYDMLVHAVNEGARRGSFDSSTTAIVSVVQTAAGPLGLQTSDVTVTCYSGSTTTTKTCSSMSFSDSVQVTANVVFTPITPLIAALVPGGTLTLNATAQRTFQ
jgi:Flp pilus assembly protein TadG